MKIKHIIALIVIIGLALIIAFLVRGSQGEPLVTQAPDLANAQLVSEGTYALAPETLLAWEGSKKIVTTWIDTGTIPASGTVSVTDGIVSGTISIDLTQITATDTGNGPSGNSALENHLKSDDFFAVGTYPTATLEITSTIVENPETFTYTVQGNLTMKDILVPIIFPVTLFQEGDTLRVVGEVTLDRTNWDIRFGSDKFFDNLGDNVISDEFTVAIDATLLPVIQ